MFVVVEGDEHAMERAVVLDDLARLGQRRALGSLEEPALAVGHQRLAHRLASLDDEDFGSHVPRRVHQVVVGRRLGLCRQVVGGRHLIRDGEATRGMQESS